MVRMEMSIRLRMWRLMAEAEPKAFPNAMRSPTVKYARTSGEEYMTHDR